MTETIANNNLLEQDTTTILDDEQKAALAEQYKSYTVDIVSKVAYLLGIRKEAFGDETELFKINIYNELEEKKETKLIRILCKLRNTIIYNFDKINSRLRYDLRNLDRMEDIIDIDEIKYIESTGIRFIKPNYLANSYIIDINKIINDKINLCKPIFPLWVEWDYIKDVFIMPNGLNEISVKYECNKFLRNKASYPFNVYSGWTALGKGNILFNDKKFLELLYEDKGRTFKDYRKVMDASASTKKSIYNFLNENEDTVIVVDCENSDPYKLYGTLKNLNPEELIKITKIILLNDIHTTSAWKILERFIHIPVEHILIERVKKEKSLVDIKVSTETCREHYVNGINSFVLCSSDSDYWALITSLPAANFLVMIEDSKCGRDIQEAMDEEGIVYCSMDDFTDGNISDIKTKILVVEMEEYIQERMHQININEMMEHAYTHSRIEMTDKEKKRFIENYVRTMRLSINDDGDLKIIIKE